MKFMENSSDDEEYQTRRTLRKLGFKLAEYQDPSQTSRCKGRYEKFKSLGLTWIDREWRIILLINTRDGQEKCVKRSHNETLML
jgi:hypothetical protein